MILEALHSKINAVVSGYPLIGDIDAPLPFAVYSADQAVLRSKAGIEGYEYTVRISVVSDSLSECLSNASGIASGIEGLVDQTENGTTFDFVTREYETQRFDVSTNRYISDLQYKMITQTV